MPSATVHALLVSVSVSCVLGSVLPPFFDIVPEVIRQYPETVLGVVYRTCNGLSLSPGMELTPLQVRGKPQVMWRARRNGYYTLLMVEPDASTRQDKSQGEFLHWMVGNIPGPDLPRGDIIAEYIGSGPGIGSGLHRYVFLLFEQPEVLSFEEEPRLNASSTAGRPQFKAQEFVEKYKLKEPAVGANYYLAQWDPYSVEMQAILGMLDK